jgi:hypothetical protein
LSVSRHDLWYKAHFSATRAQCVTSAEIAIMIVI